jgi:exosortase A
MDAEVTTATLHAPAATRPSYAREWRQAGAAMLLATVAALLLFHELAVAAVRIWIRSDTYNPCFLVIPLAAYMAWQRKSYALQFRPTPDLRALALLPVIAVGYLLVRFAGIVELQQHAVVAMLQVLFLAILGWPAYRALLWPLLYLFFLVPSGEFIVPTLQDYTAWFTIRALMASGIPTFAEGTLITIPNGNFEVAEACAGVRFLFASLAFGVLYADVMYRSAWRKLGFLVLSVIVPIVANGFRAFGIVVLAFVTDNAAAVEADHLIYGWVFFSFVLLLLILAGNWFREDDQPYGVPPEPAASATPTTARFAVVAVLAVALIASAPAWAKVVEGNAAPIRAEAFDMIGMGGGWRAVPLRQGGWRPSFPQADATAQRAYVSGDRRVELFVAYFASQNSNKKLIGGDNRFHDQPRWRRVGTATATAELADSGVRPIAERHAGPGGKRLIWYTYWIDGSFVTSGVRAKLLQAAAELKGGGRGGAMVVIATNYDDDVGVASAALADFAQSLGPLSQPMRRLAGRQ